MNEQDDSRKQETPAACGPGCCCGTSGSGGKGRWIVGVVILLIAGVLVAKAAMKNKVAPIDKTSAGFVTVPATGQTPPPETTPSPAVSDTIAGKELFALADLNTVAADTDSVFVYLPGKADAPGNPAPAQIDAAVHKLEAQGRRVGVFTLKVGSQDYQQMSAQVAVPGVLAMVKGAGMSATSGDITETKLLQAFVAASSAGGCGPASAGCGPSGCP